MARNSFPLGACNLEWTAGSELLKLGITEKESDAVFSQEYEHYDIEVDQISGPYESMIIPGAVSFNCSILVETAVLPKLSAAYEAGTTGVAYAPSGKQVIFGELKIHPISAGSKKEFDITGKKVSCIPNMNISYKEQGKALVNLVFNFSADDDPESPTFGKQFTIGEFTPKA